MNQIKLQGLTYVLAATCVLMQACGTADSGSDAESLSQAVQPPAGGQPPPITPGQCTQATAKDILIAGLVKDSWIASYPLTRLFVDGSGLVTGPSLPDVLAGDLEVINTVPDALASLTRALEKSSGLPEYGMAGMGPDTDACVGIPAWTPSGTTTVNTTSNEVFATEVNHDSWVTMQKEFGKECPLIKRIANKDIIDPPGDGSTNDPPSQTVSSFGVVANAFGICPAGSYAGEYCKLSYSTGINYTGRTCQVYYGSLRCLLY